MSKKNIKKQNKSKVNTSLVSNIFQLITAIGKSNIDYILQGNLNPEDKRYKELSETILNTVITGNSGSLNMYFVVYDLDRNFAKIGNCGIVFAADETEAIKIFRADNKIQQKTANIKAFNISEIKNNKYYYEP